MKALWWKFRCKWIAWRIYVDMESCVCRLSSHRLNKMKYFHLNNLELLCSTATFWNIWKTLKVKVKLTNSRHDAIKTFTLDMLLLYYRNYDYHDSNIFSHSLSLFNDIPNDIYMYEHFIATACRIKSLNPWNIDYPRHNIQYKWVGILSVFFQELCSKFSLQCVCVCV